MLLSLNMLLLGLLVEIMLQLVSIPNRGQDCGKSAQQTTEGDNSK